MKTNEQKLVDICFQIAVVSHHYPQFQKMTRQEVIDWTAKQLKECGFPTKPVGSSHGVLQNEK